MRKASQNEKTKKRDYLRPEHGGEGPPVLITSVFHNRRGNRVNVFYTIFGQRTQHRTPRALLVWLDDKEPDFIDKELAAWKERVNAQADPTFSACRPDFYLKDKAALIRYLGVTAAPQTVQQYIEALENHVFPFFARKLRSDKPQEWYQDYHRWYSYLEKCRLAATTRNRIRTALNGYLRFLREKKGVNIVAMTHFEKNKRAQREGKTLPGNVLPSYSEALQWLNTLKPGRSRWTIAIMLAFGVRVSEALTTKPNDLLGEHDREMLEKKEGLYKSMIAKHHPTALLNVLVADKRALVRDDIKRILGNQPETPKGGAYTAVCFDEKLSEFLAEAIEREEFKGETTYDIVDRTIEESGHKVFSQYSTHDFRRLSITHHVLHTGDMFLTSRLHGQVSDIVVRRYYQWGLEQQRQKSAHVFRPMKKA